MLKSSAPRIRAGKRSRDEAYEDHPLPIGDGQTISQPYVVALMLGVSCSLLRTTSA